MSEEAKVPNDVVFHLLEFFVLVLGSGLRAPFQILQEGQDFQ